MHAISHNYVTKSQRLPLDAPHLSTPDRLLLLNHYCGRKSVDRLREMKHKLGDDYDES